VICFHYILLRFFLRAQFSCLGLGNNVFDAAANLQQFVEAGDQ